MRRYQEQRGAGLVLVLIVAAGLILILTATIPMMVREYTHTTQRVSQVKAYHLAEGCLEATIASWNQSTSVADMLADGWKSDSSGNYLVREYAPIELGWSFPDDVVAEVRVMMDHPSAGGNLRLWSIASVGKRGSGAGSQRALVNIELRSEATFPYIGIIAKNGFNFSGSPYVDSFDSSVFPYSYAAGSNSGANAVLASPLGDNGSTDLGNATIKGNVLLGSDPASPEDAIKNSSHPTITGSLAGGYTYDFAIPVAPVPVAPLTSF